MGKGGFSGGGPRASNVELAEICCLAGKGGGWSSFDEAELSVEAMLFCEGEEQTPPLSMPSPFSERLTVDRLSLAASERSGRLDVSC